MIQRIQTIYLLLAAAAMAAVFFLPFASTATPEATSPIFQDTVFSAKEYFGLAPIFGAASLFALVAIGLFSNRMLQKVVISVGIFLVLVATGATAFVFSQDAWATANIAQLKDEFGLGMPVFAIIFNLLAIRNINKDEKLVQSMDRLR